MRSMTDIQHVRNILDQGLKSGLSGFLNVGPYCSGFRAQTRATALFHDENSAWHPFYS